MKRVGARRAKRSFGRLPREARAGKEIVIVCHGMPVAALHGLTPQLTGARRQAAVAWATRLMEKASAVGMSAPFSRDEMHER